MNRDTLLSLVRHILTALGGYLIMRGWDSSLVTTLSGVGVSLFSLVWSIKDKQLDLEKAAGLIRHILSGLGGVLLARGIITHELLENITGIVIALLPFILKDVNAKAALEKDSLA